MQKDVSEDHDEEKERALKKGVEEETKKAMEDVNEDHNEEEGGKGALKKDIKEEEAQKQVDKKVKDIIMINSDSLLCIYFPYRMHVCLDFYIFSDANVFFCCFFAMFFQSSHIESSLFWTFNAICLLCA